MDFLEEMMRERASGRGTDKPMSKTAAKERSKTLRAIRGLFTIENTFSPNDLVVWKDGMQMKKTPGYNCPGIVMAVLDEPVFDKEASSGSPYFREPLDLIIGCVDEDNDFLLLHFDSRRFEHYKER